MDDYRDLDEANRKRERQLLREALVALKMQRMVLFTASSTMQQLAMPIPREFKEYGVNISDLIRRIEAELR